MIEFLFGILVGSALQKEASKSPIAKTQEEIALEAENNAQKLAKREWYSRLPLRYKIARLLLQIALVGVVGGVGYETSQTLIKLITTATYTPTHWYAWLWTMPGSYFIFALDKFIAAQGLFQSEIISLNEVTGLLRFGFDCLTAFMINLCWTTAAWVAFCKSVSWIERQVRRTPPPPTNIMLPS